MRGAGWLRGKGGGVVQRVALGMFLPNSRLTGFVMTTECGCDGDLRGRMIERGY